MSKDKPPITNSQQTALKLLGLEVSLRTYGAVIEDGNYIYMTWFRNNTYWEATLLGFPEARNIQLKIIQIMGHENVQ